MSKESRKADKLKTDRIVLDDMKEMLYVIDHIQHSVIIVNRNLEIAHANNSFLDLSGVTSIESIRGQNFGDLVKCANMADVSSECEYGNMCGVRCIENIFSGCIEFNKELREEYRLIFNNSKFMDSLLTANPLNIQGRQFILISLTDIGETKWKKALEKIFFHDILNSASALKECLNLMDGLTPDGNEELLSISKKISENLIDEITSHRQLLMAERNEYQPQISKFDCNEILLDISNKARYSLLAEEKNINIIKSEHKIIDSDRTLVSRAIFNLVKNALEATKKNGTVELYCLVKDNSIEFIVKNLDVIPQNLQDQIFNKSFSTKGTGRGLGTYSAKLLTEKFLRGKLFFESGPGIGTVFHAVYPTSISA